MVLSPQQLPGYPTNPPEYSQVPPPNYSNQPTGYPQFVPGYQQQPGIHHTFADGTNQAVITPVIITVSSSEHIFIISSVFIQRILFFRPLELMADVAIV